MDKYKENSIRIAKMLIPQWCKDIDTLKNLKCDNENKDYYVNYKKENQRKNREFQFHNVTYSYETHSFVFVEYVSAYMDGKLTDEIASSEIIMDIAIDSLQIREKTDWVDYIF